MTYPPQPGQPPYGQQPGGYGQGRHLQSGGFAQQGGQYPQATGYPQQSPYGQPGAGYGQYGQQNPYGQQGGGYGPQPPKKKTGLWIGLSATAVAVTAFLITGLLAPGFLLGDDNDDSGNTAAPSTGNTPASSPTGTGDVGGIPSTPSDSGTGDSSGANGDADSVIGQFIDAVNTGDKSTAMRSVCEGTESTSEEAIDTAIGGSASLTAEPAKKASEQSGSAVYSAVISGTIDGSEAYGAVGTVDLQGQICVAAFYVS